MMKTPLSTHLTDHHESRKVQQMKRSHGVAAGPTRAHRGWWVGMVSLPVLVGLCGTLGAAELGPQLQHQLMFRDGRLPRSAPFAPPAVGRDFAKVYVVFRETPGGRDLDELEAQGVRFTRFDGASGPAHVDRIFGVQVPWALIPRLAGDPRIARLEAADRRGRIPSMDLSMPEVEVDLLRFVPQAGADGLTGRGQIIAAFDTSVDLYHPALLKPDGGIYDWIDLDGDGLFTLDVDRVDLDRDGVGKESETLRLLENAIFDVQFGPLEDGYLDTDQDWLYADTDTDGMRDYGLEDGFGEEDLAYGEPLFIVEDANENGLLDVGEQLIRLGSSKVFAALDGESSTVTHYRGSNLMSLAPDVYPHGTSVASILLGDLPGRLYAGVAPEAELIEVSYEAPGVDIVSAMSFARSRGSDVMVYEFGEWSGEFLDGSSALEEAVTSMAELGIPQVCPSGNIGNNNKHGLMDVPAGGIGFGIFFVDASFSVSSTYITGLWRQSLPELTFQLEFISADGVSTNGPVVASPGSTTTNGEGDYVAAVRATSDRGTNMMDLTLYRKEDDAIAPAREGLYYLTVENSGEATATLHLYLADDRSGWTGGVTWTSSSAGSPGAIADPTYSVSSPAVADSCIVVGSYATRQSEVLGDLSSFSGQGPRIDQAPLLDVAAPGNYDVISATSSDATYFDASINAFPYYPFASSWLFSGTSAAAPHVAGAIALLKQLDGGLSHVEAEEAIREGAETDDFTGSVPNDAWGMGKLRVRESVQLIDGLGPSFAVLMGTDPVMPNYLVFTLVPSERLAGPPEVTNASLELSAVQSLGNDLYQVYGLAPASGSEVSFTVSGVDEAGNSGASSHSEAF